MRGDDARISRLEAALGCDCNETHACIFNRFNVLQTQRTHLLQRLRLLPLSDQCQLVRRALKRLTTQFIIVTACDVSVSDTVVFTQNISVGLESCASYLAMLWAQKCLLL